MDQRTFDRLARVLGGATDRRAGLKAAFGALLGAGGAAAALDIDAEAKKRGKDNDADRTGAAGPEADKRKKKKKKCKPACESGFTCVKGACVCPSGIECGGACCASGKACVAGACADEPGPTPSCIPAGEQCKNAGRPCCDGRTCASGQGGGGDVACYSPKTGRCERTADCVYGMSCRGGRCAPPLPGDLAQPCDTASQQLCATPGATCTAYTGPGAPDGNFCTLPLESACSGDPECTCYRCWYVNPGVSAARDGRAAARFACCGPEGYACTSDRNCCLGTSCVSGTCRGALAIPTAETCSTAPGSPACLDAAAACQSYASGTPSGTWCLFSDGSGACAADNDCASKHCRTTVVPHVCVQCLQDSDCAAGKFCRLADNTCQDRAATGTTCAGNVPCLDAPNATCTTYAQSSGGPTPGNYCLLADGKTCSSGNGKCVSNFCAPDGTCKTPVDTGQTCTPNVSVCRNANATCTTYASGSGGDVGNRCLVATAAPDPTCAAPADCVSNVCPTATPQVCRQCTTNAGCVSLNISKPYCNANTCSADCASTILTSPAPAGSFRYPNGAAVSGNFVWITNTRGQNAGDAPWVTKLNRTDGTLVSKGTVGWTAKEYLMGISVGTDGVPLVADYIDGTVGDMTPTIYKVNADGSRGDAWYTLQYSQSPFGIYIDGTATDGTVWVTGGTKEVENNLYKFTVASGTVTLAETFSSVCTLARQVAKSGRANDPYVYVACQQANEVRVIDPDTGTTVKTISAATNARGLAFNGDAMYTADVNAGTVQAWSLSGVGADLTATKTCLSPALATPTFMGMLAPDATASQVWAAMFDAGKVVEVKFSTVS